MSFGGGGSQGQIRYALLVDDQATAKLNVFKNSITQLGTSTTKVQSNIQAFTAQLSKQSTAFSAGINPIKQQGAALTTLTTNLKTHATQLTGVGSKIKDTASKFAGFATGLSATASGVLQLGAGFRDYNDAQIAVERVTRKNSLAQEALHKAQDKLIALTNKGVKSGKEYEQAQLDVSQAQAQVSIQTQLLGEAQERMFDSQSQFVASVIPATLGAVGTLGSAFKDLGGTKGLGGLTEKFKDLGSTNGMGGLIDKFKNLGSSATGAIGSKGSGILGIGIALAGIGAVAITAFDAVGKINEQLATMRQVSSGAVKPIEGVRMELDKVAKLDTSNIQGIIETIGSLFSGSFGAANIVKNLTKDLKDANPEVKTFSSGIKIYADNTVAATKATQDELNILSRRNEAMAKARQQDIDVAAALGEVISKTTAAADDAKRQVDAVKQLDTALNKTIPSFLKFAEAGASSAEATKLVVDMVKLTKDRMIEWNPAAGASADIIEYY
jgi:chromosome segregation ATPase